MIASHPPTHGAAVQRLLRHRQTQIMLYFQCVCRLARIPNGGRMQMEKKEKGVNPKREKGVKPID